MDLEKIGIEPSEITESLLDDLFAPMKKDNERVYFNFLYRLLNFEKPSYDNYASEFIEGYARVGSYGFEKNPKFTDKNLLPESLISWLAFKMLGEE